MTFNDIKFTAKIIVDNAIRAHKNTKEVQLAIKLSGSHTVYTNAYDLNESINNRDLNTDNLLILPQDEEQAYIAISKIAAIIKMKERF